MGQKVHPIGFRLGVIKEWSSKWYANSKDFADTLNKDIQARAFIKKKYEAISQIWISRPGGKGGNAHITIETARPGNVLGNKGQELEKLREQLTRMLGVPVSVKVEEIRKPELDANLVAENIAQQLVRRILFRRAMKRAAASAMRAGAQGIKIMVSGRLGGAEIARTEWSREGRVPLHTLRADIDYAEAQAKTTYGIIGVKVWIFKGEVLGQEETSNVATEAN